MTNLLRLKKSQGVATLIVTTMLLVTATLIVLFASNYTNFKQKTTSNQTRYNQAYQAAEAGLEAGIQYLNANKAAILASPAGGYIQPFSNSSTTNVVLANNSRYTIVYTNPIQNNYTLINIQSTGTGDDGSSTRVVSQQVQFKSALLTTPSVPMTSVGAVSISGSSNVINTQTNETIISGGGVSFGGSGSTTISAGGGSGKGHAPELGSDVETNAPGLTGLTPEQFFTQIFGVSQTTMQSLATVCTTVSACSLDSSSSGIYWVNSDTTINNSVATQVGSPTSPVLLIVNGDFAINGDSTLYGVVYASGSSTIGNGTAQIIGSLLSAGSVSSTGNISVTYDQSVLANVQNLGTFAKVPGTWKDF